MDTGFDGLTYFLVFIPIDTPRHEIMSRALTEIDGERDDLRIMNMHFVRTSAAKKHDMMLFATDDINF